MALLTQRLRSVSTAIGLTYVPYLLGSILILFTSIILTGVGIQLSTRPGLRLLLGTVLLQGVTYGGLAVAYLHVRDLGFEFVPFSVPDARESVVIVGGTLILLGLLFVVSELLSTFGIEAAQNRIVVIGQQNPEVFLLLIPLSFLLVGPGEELLFRGLVQGTLREAIHPTRAVILASALFASIHLFSLSGEGKAVYIAVAFVLALVLGAVYEYTENLAVPAVIHGAYNAIQFANAYISATGGL
jgi:membrane protease YdiL (CAAX protease family)